jgi:Ca2+-transporting ATPase
MVEKTFWHNLSIEKVIKILETDLEQGLAEKEVKERQKTFGKNKLPEEKPLSSLKIYFEQFRSPLIYILVIAGIITLILKEFTDAIVIFGAVFLNAIVGFLQENKASQALRALKRVVKHEAEVLRGGNLKIIDSIELVPGDIIILKPGDKVPADGRLIEAHNLKTNEMALTGEWLAASKTIDILPKETPVPDRDNMVYMGTIVEDGKARAIVTATGLQTEIGKVAEMLKETKEEKTPLQKKLAHLGKIIGAIIVVICLFIFILGVIVGKAFLEIFTVSVALAVAAIPSGLPVAMTVILAIGMQRILKRKGLVRKLLATETLGSTSIICTDKTATLTEGKMQVAVILTETKELLSDGKKYSEKINKNGEGSHILALKIVTLCNEAFVENPEEVMERWIIRGRPTDRALLQAGMQAGLNKKELEKRMPKIDEMPFDPIHKYLASLYKLNENQQVLYVCGAPEKILSLSTGLEIEGKSERLTSDKLERMEKKLTELTQKGLRVIAVAYKKYEVVSMKYEKLEEICKDLVFVGFVGLKDPLRKEVKEAVKICRQAGMRPIIITGDHKLTAKAIAEELDFRIKEENIIEGKDLDQMSDQEFEKKVKKIQVYARAEPRHKMRIIDAWQKKGKVVAMTGDGINDAPALKAADIGVAVGSGTDVAKGVADLILLPDSFNIIVAAIEEGRVIIDNLRKVITYLLSVSFSEVVLIGVTLPFGFPLPLLAGQILWINLLEGSLPAFSLGMEPKEKDIMERKPEGKSIPLLIKESKALIFIIVLFSSSILLALFLWLYFGGHDIAYIRTMIFACLALESFFYIFSCRSLRKNLWQINPFSNKYLLGAWVFAVIMLLLAIYLPPLQTLLRTVPLGLQDWLIFVSFGILGLILIEATKWYFIAKREYGKISHP